MSKLINELRRRQVFRASGLYIGGVWIVLQVVSLILPIYDAPEWIMKALISVAIVGFPVIIVLAWVFDITPEGIRLETQQVERRTRATSRNKMDFVIVAVLLVALFGSLFGNFSPRKPVILENVEPVSILIADFDNSTGDRIFDGALEQALTIAVEESRFITVFDRVLASDVLTQFYSDSKLDAAGARLVSAREGIGIVLNGKLDKNTGKYEISISSIDVESGEELVRLSKKAKGKSEVLGIIGELARDLREKLGDVNAEISSEGEESFTTVSLEAMHDYVNAQSLARDGLDEQAIKLYQSAVDKDPKFGRAWAGLAVAADKLGRTDDASLAWRKTLPLLNGMTERERLRTEGVYYTLVAKNSQKALENYKTLVEKYPADDAAYNNLAVSYFFARQFDKALAAGRKVLDIYPKRPMYQANYALYAMYASDFDTALVEAKKTLNLNPNYHKAYLPIAVSALVNGDTAAARTAYVKMAATSDRGTALAKIGLADLMLWSGDTAGARIVLREGMEIDEEAVNNRALATKKMILASALLQEGYSADDISAQIAESLALTSNLSQQVQAALMYVKLDFRQEAMAIATELGSKLETQQRAYSKLIMALIAANEGEKITPIETLQEALALEDIWLVRFYLGQAYFNAGHYAEAVSEFMNCGKRLGEAYSLFLDDTPTFRFTAKLNDWLNRARDNMTAQP
ncbi:MAG: tetratricopeptide (TPR) repeat protein [Paraglaciecola sp.]|jgi:tetratricopeptide (TPR) repeat protein